MISLSDIFAQVSPEPNTGCWLWAGKGGEYGIAETDGGEVPAHRAAYEAATGNLDPVLVIDHLCGEKFCVNPAHLEQITARANLSRGQPQTNGRGAAGSMRPGPRAASAVLIRLTTEEHERIKEAAQRSGLGVGPWLRSLALLAARAPAA